MYPEEAAAPGRLDRVPVHEWPMIAAHWLVEGYDSEAIRTLAGLPAEDTRTVRKMMVEALRSLGYKIIEEREFAERCKIPLGIVQRDLDITGYGEYRMRPVNLASGPIYVEMWAALPDGSSWSGGGGGMTPDMDDAALLWHAARSVSDTLGEVLGMFWPLCATHGGQPMTPPEHREVEGGLIDGVVWWWCRDDIGHPSAPVGQLSKATARAR